MTTPITTQWHRWRRATEGGVAVIVALSLLPLMTGLGIGMDVARAQLSRARLAQALDAAALAAGATAGLSDQQARAQIQAWFDANHPAGAIGTPGELTIAIGESTIDLSVKAEVPTVVMGLAGVKSITVAAHSQVTRESGRLEVALVLDNTGSMGSNNRLASLRTAAGDLTDILFGDNAADSQGEPATRMAVVPFSAGVNAGRLLRQDGALDEAGESSIDGENFNDPSVSRLTLYDDLRNRTWNGCVESRRAPFDVLDEPPDASDPDTLWVPWFAPDEPDISDPGTKRSYSNDYLRDGISGKDVAARQAATDKYAGRRVTSSSRGPGAGCETAEVTPLTGDVKTIKAAINAMRASGYTHIPLGLAWGWRVLSPQAPFSEGVAYDDPEVAKALILLTDGDNTVAGRDTHNLSDYTGYGYLASGRLGTTDANDARDVLDEKTALLCERIKDAGIRLYTITFQVSSSRTRTLMRNCASDSSAAFDSPSGEDLQKAFRVIAGDLGTLRLSR